MYIIGRIKQVRLNIGSKAECNGFVIITPNGDETPIIKDGDNPFENESLQTLVGSKVRAEGEFYYGRMFADTVEKID